MGGGRIYSNDEEGKEIGDGRQVGWLPIPVSLQSHALSISMFNGLNFSHWCEQIQFHLGVMDLDLSLRVEKPAAITDTSSDDEKNIHDAWEKSNRLSLMFMRMSVPNNIKSALPHTESAKEFMKFVGERSQTIDKSLAGTLMATLTTMKFDGSRCMHEHVIEMTNIAARLKSLGMNVDENFLVQFIINSLPTEYGPFQMNYNTMKDKWNVNGLHRANPVFAVEDEKLHLIVKKETKMDHTSCKPSVDTVGIYLLSMYKLVKTSV
ncbi:hypothetical protein ZIOFF_057028 [Zingiber officinale]|uniref:UBN2 domain-containing protein n=1 Tax=Zingiber officinale TaxID=94328 RepID=A0A8J5KQR2_ZINOF|nr:hypothetical protein ZIOFF_057028 [Zingiber officinale]